MTLEPGSPNSLLDADRSALVVHAKAYDNVSDPAGNAGDRIACVREDVTVAVHAEERLERRLSALQGDGLRRWPARARAAARQPCPR